MATLPLVSAVTGEAAHSVLIIATDLSGGGGVNRVICDLAAMLVERLQAQVTVISARSAATPAYAIPDGVELIATDQGRGLGGYMHLLWRLRRRRFAFVIGPWTHDNLLLIALFLASPTRVIAMEHATWRFHRWPIRLARCLIYPLAWRVLALNRSEFHHYRRFLSNVVLMPNAVAARPAVNSVRTKLVIAVGHLTRLKNFGDTLRAMARSGLEADGWSLAIIGAGPEAGALREMIGALGLTRTTIEPPTKDIESWYARAAMLVHSSTMEVFPMVLAESMAAGVIPIAYDADGRSFILEGFADHLVPFGDVAALAARMRRFASADQTPLRGRLRASIESRFSPAVIAERWQGLLAGGAQ